VHNPYQNQRTSKRCVDPRGNICRSVLRQFREYGNL
jgi:hypothetical protein